MIFCSWVVHGNESLNRLVMEDFLCLSIREFREFEKANPDRVCTFNDRTYLQNESGQWISARYEVPANFQEWLKDLAGRGVCPKEHKGVYLDQSIYECGIWYCRDVVRSGERCPYHLDTQYPGGIPK